MPSTAPTLTADTTNNNLANDIVLTFTDNALWRAAITSVQVTGTTITSAYYTIIAGQITIKNPLFAIFEEAGLYTISILATGYNATTVEQTITCAKWTDLVLYGDGSESPALTDNREEYEKLLLSLSTGYITRIAKTTVKNFIFERLIFYFKEKQIDIDNSASIYNSSSVNLANVIYLLDHIVNPIRLRQASVFYSLYLLFNRQSVSPEDQYYLKAKDYLSRFKESFQIAIIMLRFDETVTNISNTRPNEVEFSR